MMPNRSAAIAAVVAATVAAAPVAAADPFSSSPRYDQETVAIFVSTVRAEAQRWGTGPIEVFVGQVDDPNLMAETDYRGRITINADWAAMEPARFNALVAEDVAVGFHPGGCGGIQTVAIHEVGHVIDLRTGLVARRAVAEAAAAGQVNLADLHSYALASPGEAVAVSFQAAECGTATRTELAITSLLVGSS